jgi:hypothetical protein
MQNNSGTLSTDAATQTQSTSTTTQSQQGTSSTATANGGTSTQTFPKPNFGRYFIPVLGTYNSSENAGTSTTEETGKTVTVTPDESNPGKVWIEGLTTSKFYALLKTAPGTYKIPAQKQEDKSIQEGTVVYDDASREIKICVGCGYQDGTIAETAPASENTSTKAKSKTKSKTKASTIISFTGTKSEQGTVYNQF